MENPYITKSRLSLLLLCLWISPNVDAANIAPIASPHCERPPLFEAMQVPAQLDNQVYLSGDRGTAKNKLEFQFSGNIQLKRNQQYLSADKATYFKADGQLQAQGNIHFQTPKIVIKGDHATLNLFKESGEIKQAQYYLNQRLAHGQATTFNFSEKRITMKQGSYTTCSDPDHGWLLRAAELSIDEAKNEGVAKHVRLEMARLPVFYFPWISFPLAGRKSGFLSPNIDNSDRNGFDMSLPYYLNLAPQRDMTLAPRFISKRGLQLAGELRYLYPRSNGILLSEYLAHDRITGQKRSYSKFQHRHSLLLHSQWDTHLEHVDDNDYFRDLGTNLLSTSRTQMSRQTLFSSYGEHWQLSARLQDYRLLSQQTQPYRLLPQVQLISQASILGFQYGLKSQVSYYQHDDLADTRRLLLEPFVRYPWLKPWGFIKLDFSARQLYYQIEARPDRPHYRAYSASLDTGLYFERFGRRFVQTLEPRAYYLYSPWVNQSTIPNMDSGLVRADKAWLFRRYLLNGNDFNTHVNRLSLDLSSRLLNKNSGQQLLLASISSAFYLENQKVTFPGESIYKRGHQLLGFDLLATPRRSLKYRLQWFVDPQEKQPSHFSSSFEYTGKSQVFFLNYREQKESYQQVDSAASIRLGADWSLVASSRYALDTQFSPESVVGLEYNNCCWSIRVLGRMFRSDPNAPIQRHIGLQFEFKGLTSVGQNLQKRFGSEILGYQDEN